MVRTLHVLVMISNISREDATLPEGEGGSRYDDDIWWYRLVGGWAGVQGIGGQGGRYFRETGRFGMNEWGVLFIFGEL